MRNTPSPNAYARKRGEEAEDRIGANGAMRMPVILLPGRRTSGLLSCRGVELLGR